MAAKAGLDGFTFPSIEESMNTPQRRPVLVGGAGVRNFGDELIVRLWLDLYASVSAPPPIVSVSNADFMAQLLAGHSAAPGFVKTFDSLSPPPAAAADFWEAIRLGLLAVERLGLDAIVASLGAVPSSIHLHGGGYLNSMWPRNGFLVGMAVGLKRVAHCPLVATGIGLLPQAKPPAGNNIAIFEEAMAAFDLFEVRDRPSFDFIENHLGARDQLIDGLDDTYLVPIRPQVRHSPTLAISGFRAGNMPAFLRTLPQGYVASFERIVFWAATPRDFQIRDQLLEVFPTMETLDLMPLVGGGPLPVTFGDVMIADRFHPHLLAARQGATGAFRTDGNYYDVKHGSVVALGSPFVPLDQFDAQASLTPITTSAIVERETALVAKKAATTSRVLDALRG